MNSSPRQLEVMDAHSGTEFNFCTSHDTVSWLHQGEVHIAWTLLAAASVIVSVQRSVFPEADAVAYVML